MIKHADFGRQPNNAMDTSHLAEWTGNAGAHQRRSGSIGGWSSSMPVFAQQLWPPYLPDLPCKGSLGLTAIFDAVAGSCMS